MLNALVQYPPLVMLPHCSIEAFGVMLEFIDRLMLAYLALPFFMLTMVALNAKFWLEYLVTPPTV